MKSWKLSTVLVVALVAGTTASAFAIGPYTRREIRRAPNATAWYGDYYHSSWGMPTGLVVPPCVEAQTHWGWGVGSTRITPIRNQFQRDYPGTGSYPGNMFRPTPPWPSSTDQFGVYYIRGPW